MKKQWHEFKVVKGADGEIKSVKMDGSSIMVRKITYVEEEGCAPIVKVEFYGELETTRE